MQDYMVQRRNFEKETVEFKKQQVGLERNRLAAEKDRFMKSIQTIERLPEIKQKCLDIYDMKRRGASEERYKAVDFLSFLAEHSIKK